MFTPASVVLLSGVLFVVGAFGVIARRNLIIVLMSVEIMLAAGSLALVTFARMHGGEAGAHGQVMVLLVMAVSAAEAAVGLAILMALYRQLRSVNSDHADRMRG